MRTITIEDDEFDDLEEERDELERKLAEAEADRDNFEERKDELEAELGELQEKWDNVNELLKRIGELS